MEFALLRNEKLYRLLDNTSESLKQLAYCEDVIELCVVVFLYFFCVLFS